MREIQLTQNQVALVDDEDFEWLSKLSWRAFKGSNDCWRAATDIDRKVILMHRMIMKAAPEQKVDHRDRNALNNQKSNLRFCNTQQNANNRSPNKIKKYSPYKGVSKAGGKLFIAQIKHNGVNIPLGCFASDTDAAKAYNEAAIKLFGEFAFLNDV